MAYVHILVSFLTFFSSKKKRNQCILYSKFIKYTLQEQLNCSLLCVIFELFLCICHALLQIQFFLVLQLYFITLHIADS